MFTKGNSIVLNKSGELMINTTNIKSDSILKSPISSPKIILDSSSLTTPKINNRDFSWYNKFVKNNVVISSEVDEAITTFNFNNFIKLKINEGKTQLENEQVTKEQWLVYLERFKALDLSYVHTIILDIISKNETTIKFMYHVITTKDKIVNYGGPNQFKPIYLYTDEKGTKFYTIPLTYIRILSKEEFVNVFKFKKESEFKDNPEAQKKITEALIIAEKKFGHFKQVDVNGDILYKNIKDIDPNESFPDKDSHYIITDWAGGHIIL